MYRRDTVSDTRNVTTHIISSSNNASIYYLRAINYLSSTARYINRLPYRDKIQAAVRTDANCLSFKKSSVECFV